MNLDPIEKIFKPAQKVGLEEKRKDAIHQEVLRFMKAHPLTQEHMQQRNWFGFMVANMNGFKLRIPAVALASLMLFLSVGGIASVKASFALPGDVLYPMKVGFNEKIEEVLAFSDTAKLNLNIRLAELRLQEAEKLTIQGRFNGSQETQLNSDFQDRVRKVSLYANQLHGVEDEKKLEVASVNFEAMLRAHGIIIDGLHKNTPHQASGPLVGNIESITSHISMGGAVSNNISKDSKQTSNQDNEKNIQEKISAVEKSVTAIKKLIEDNKAKIGPQGVSQLEDNLNLVQQNIDEGRRHIQTNNDYQSSASSLRRASVIVQESKYLIDAKNRLGVNVPINIPAQHNIGTDTKGSHDDQGNQQKQNQGPVELNTKVEDSLKVNVLP